MARNIAVGVGLMEFPFASTDGFWRWVDLCEAGGIDSIWQTDRIVSRQPILECMTALAAIAGRTRRIKFGVNVVSLALRDPVLLAKQCATIDVLSQGRLLPGFGIGSPQGPEWQTLHIDTTTRGRRTDEALEIIHRLWSEDSVDFEGRHNHLTGASISPKPVQPDLPMWIGGSSAAAVRRTARYGTGWQAGAETPADVGRVIAEIKAALVESGRSIDEDHYGAAFAYHFGRIDDPGVAQVMEAYRKRTGRDPERHFAIGDAGTMLARIAEYVEAGASKFILRPAARGRRGHAGADAAADRAGAADGGGALAEAGEGGVGSNYRLPRPLAARGRWIFCACRPSRECELGDSQQHAVLGRERHGDLAAFVEQLGRRAAHDQLAGRPVHHVLDEVAVEHAAMDAARHRVVRVRHVRRDGCRTTAAPPCPARADASDATTSSCMPPSASKISVPFGADGPRTLPAIRLAEPTKSATKRLRGRL